MATLLFIRRCNLFRLVDNRRIADYIVTDYIQAIVDEVRVVTIRDVASEAGVSVATVSRVLNNPETVRESTRKRVEAVIEAINYRPDSNARRLSTGRSFNISVVMPFITRPSFVERLRGIEAALSHSVYDLVVSNIESISKRDTYYDVIIRERRFDGTLIMSLPPHPEEAEAIHKARIPVVLVDASHPLLPSVNIDNHEGGRMAAEHLLARGYQRIAFLGDTEHELQFSHNRERLQGFAERLEEAGLPFPEVYRFWISHNRRAARKVVERILAIPPGERPTAIFATSDTTACGLLDGLRQHGMRAPEDLAVIGFDDLELAELYNLTTVRQPLFQSGARAVERILALLERDEISGPQQLLLPITLVTRGTT